MAGTKIQFFIITGNDCLGYMYNPTLDCEDPKLNATCVRYVVIYKETRLHEYTYEYDQCVVHNRYDNATGKNFLWVG